MKATAHLVRGAALLGAACLISIAPAQAQTAPAISQQIIVKWKSSATSASRQSAMSNVQARMGVSMIPMRVLATQGEVMRSDRTMSASQMQSLIGMLATDAAVEYAHEDILLKPQQEPAPPNDPLYSQQLGRFVDLRVLQLNIGIGGRVAVIDSGIRPHPDLGQLIGGYDFISDPFIANDGDGRDASPLDPGDFTQADACGVGLPASDSSWHGTHVTGMIAAVSNNGIGIAGMGQDLQVVPIRAIGRCGGRISDVADALLWAAGIPVPGAPVNPYPARVINLSLGAVAPCVPTAQEAIDAITGYTAAATLVVAAGNGNIDAANFLPANCNSVIAVAALTRDGKKASYSNFGSVIDIAAPGGDLALGPTEGVISTLNAGRTTPGAATFGVKNGTSMATAHVSAVVGMMSAWNFYTCDQLEDMLKFQTRQGTGPCEFPKCIRAINDYAAVLEAFSHQYIPYYE